MLGTHKRTNWPTERVDKLVALLDDGYSASQAAAAMGCTRNSIIGVASRKKLAFKSQQVAWRPAATIPKSAKPIRTTPFRPAPRHLPNSGSRLSDDAAAVPFAQPRSLLELKDYHCRWPNGDVGKVDFNFCGGMVEEGKPYCPHHCRIAYRQPGQREEQAA